MPAKPTTVQLFEISNLQKIINREFPQLSKTKQLGKAEIMWKIPPESHLIDKPIYKRIPIYKGDRNSQHSNPFHNQTKKINQIETNQKQKRKDYFPHLLSSKP
uniref:Uncharacterized protein n=1 Tax=Opuntia streptacantha TaxID=393608 RepID=A0A7C8Z7V2_OPUST